MDLHAHDRSYSMSVVVTVSAPQPLGIPPRLTARLSLSRPGSLRRGWRPQDWNLRLMRCADRGRDYRDQTSAGGRRAGAAGGADANHWARPAVALVSDCTRIGRTRRGMAHGDEVWCA